MNLNKTILNQIGNTPLLKLENIYIKCEFLNPSGSVKDRIAKYIIEKAEKTSKIKKSYTIVEASTGNTGISLAMVGVLKRYKVIIYIPKGLSKERYKMMQLLGAELRYVPKDQTKLAREKALQLGKKPKFFHTKQFSNEWNYEEHQKSMAKEIIKQLKGKKVDAVVAGIGTGGTIVGLAKAFKKINPKLKVYGVEPEECPLIYQLIHNKKKICKHHKIEGIGDGFIPDIIKNNIKLIDNIIKINSNDAIKESKNIAENHGCLVGICSGANLLAAKKIKKEEPKLKTIITLFTDSGQRYLSEKWFVK